MITINIYIRLRLVKETKLLTFLVEDSNFVALACILPGKKVEGPE
jgi:hypothetical protein